MAARKNKPPVIIPEDQEVGKVLTPKFIDNFINERAENIHNSPTLSNYAKIDRDYLMGMFAMIYNEWKGSISEKKTHPLRRYTPKQMFEGASKYIQVTIEHGQPLTLTALGIFMGIRRQELFTMVNEREVPKEEEFIYDIMDFIENYNEYAAHKKQNPAGPIFILKNLGWKDKFEIEASSNPGALSEEEREAAQKRLRNFSE